MTASAKIQDPTLDLMPSSPTKRVTVPALEDILYESIPVLDHGFIRVIDYFGSDESIVQAARVSYGRGTKKSLEDQGLINYLMRHWHTTPFEMCEIKLHVKLPIFIARQWIRHRTANVNEYSARYSVLDREFYMPDPSQLSSQSQTNRQGRSNCLTGAEAERVLHLLKNDAELAYDHYQEMLNINDQGEIVDPSKEGLARELARMNLPVNYYTQWYWKTDLHNFMNFVRLRADDHAQYEIQAYANVMRDILKRWAPMAYQSFLDYRMNSFSLSSKSIAVVKRMIKGENVTVETSGLTKREWNELSAQLFDE
jgi:thymidylate synthase (FAD)